MELSRRTVLGSAGAVGASALGFGYWQRRRLWRYSAIRDFREVAGIEVPRIDDDSVVTSTVLEPAYDRAIGRFDEIESRLNPPFDRYSEEFVEQLRDELTEMAPDRVTVESLVPEYGAPAMHAARRQALAMYGIRRSRLISILAHEEPQELPPEAFEERSTTVHDRTESVAVAFQGRNLGEAIVAGATIESAISSAGTRLQRAEREDEHPARWSHLERATAASEEAELLVHAREGTEFDDNVPVVAKRLVDAFERRRAAAPDPVFEETSGSDEDTPSFANSAIGYFYRSMRLLRASPAHRRRAPDDGEYGRAAHTHALLVPTVSAYEAFAEVPQAGYWWDELDFELGATPEEVRLAKRAAIDAVEPYLDTNDPLVDHLAAVPLGVIRDADRRQVRPLVDDANTLDDREWAKLRDHAVLKYEAARHYAETIDETMDIVAAVS